MKKITIWLLCMCVLLSGCTTEKIYVIQTCDDNQNITLSELIEKEDTIIRWEDREMECRSVWWDGRGEQRVYPLYHWDYYERVPADNSPWSRWSEQCR